LAPWKGRHACGNALSPEGPALCMFLPPLCGRRICARPFSE
jgi:hypothetical protein